MMSDTSGPIWNSKPPMIVGFCALAVLFFGVGLWSVAISISGAVISSGVIEVESNRQVVQHPNGGVVAAINARNGQIVKKGDVLIQFDGTELNANLNVALNQLTELQARKSRLEAERDAADSVAFPPNLILKSKFEDNLKSQLAGQVRFFEAARDAYVNEIEQLQERENQFLKQIEGLENRLVSLGRQRDLLAADLKAKRSLIKRKLIQSTAVSEVELRLEQMNDDENKLEVEIAQLRGEIASTKIEISKLGVQRREKAIGQLRDLQPQEIETSEKVNTFADRLAKLEVRAPSSGVVYGSTVFALQSVVQAGAPMLYVVPQDKPLIVAVQVPNIHRDQIFPDQDVALRFSAFEQKDTPEVEGKIKTISADAYLDETSRQQFYLVHILPKEEELAKIDGKVLLPGMPVEAFIKTGDRTPLAFLTKPLTDYFKKAFRG